MNNPSFFSIIQNQLEQVESRMRLPPNSYHPQIGAAINHLLSSGGKRIRPAIVLLTGSMLGGGKEKLIELSAAIELLHTATLVHDDLIDGALLRRGIATLNANWTVGATVLTGDFIFAHAARVAAETDCVPLIKVFSQTLTTIVNGEITQMFSSKGSVSREDYYLRIYSKTASLFELATMAAAILSPVDEKKVQEIRQLGYQLGMAFQIVDDILDFTGDQSTVGKPVANDLRQGIITLPAICYVEMTGNSDELRALIEQKQFRDDQFVRLIDSIRQSGAIQKAMNEAQQFVNRGLDILKDQPECPEKSSLNDLASYITDRKL